MSDPSDSSTDSLHRAAMALLPPGDAFSKAPGGNISKLLKATIVELARLLDNTDILYRNCFPNSVNELLDEWEEALGLPSECVTNPSTDVDIRKSLLKSRLRGRSTHEVGLYDTIAGELGYDYTVDTYNLFTMGTSVGEPLYGDEWAHVFDIVIDHDLQEYDEELECAIDDLRRAHALYNYLFEGPYGIPRSDKVVYEALDLSVSNTIHDAPYIILRYSGIVSIQVIITDGAGGAPTGSPLGTFELWVSADGENFSYLEDAEVDMSYVSPVGDNAQISAYASFTDFPGKYFKILYNRTSGGSGDVAQINVTLG